VKGIYTLAVEVEDEFEVGALGLHEFDGRYVYVGSALGPGGLKRVARHLGVKEGEVRRWHVDYLLARGEVVSVDATTTSRYLECRLAAILSEELPVAVEGFGCSDCGCDTHLFGPGPAVEASSEAHAALADSLNSS